MCQQLPPRDNVTTHDNTNAPFPWHIPICDAHCHPTDTMASVESFPTMHATALTVMATRPQDQELVADVAAQYPVLDRKAFSRQCAATAVPDDDEKSVSATTSEGPFVVPAFGWHPWFSYLLYDDEAPKPTYRPATSTSGPGAGPDHPSGPPSEDTAKATHYASVLAPAPSPDFIASLPNPVPISSFISSTETRLQAHPYALVGEIGLDKAFRLPQAWAPSDHSTRDDGLTPGGREGRLLSPYRVRMEHQRVILMAQLRLAAKMRRAVSIHGVQAHGVLHDALAATWKGHEKEVVSRRKRRLVAQGAEDFSSDSEDDDDNDEPKPYAPRICLHSFSASVTMLKQYLNPAIPARIFMSFSSAVNLSSESSSTRTDEVIRALPDDRVLIESDLHTAGEPMDAALEEMYRHVCEIKGWALQEGVARIAKNYEEFIYG